MTLALLYFYKERTRLFNEVQLENRIAYDECKRLSSMMDEKTTCTLAITEHVDTYNIFKEIGAVYIIVMLLTLVLTYFLAKMALRPMHDSIDKIDSFIGSIIHDINTPLSVIKLSSQSMAKSLPENLVQKNGRVLEALKEIDSLQEQLLLALKSDNIQLQKRIFDIKQLIESRVEYYSGIRDSVKIVTQVSTLNIEADYALIVRMIDNIVLNAIKYSDRDAKVEILLFGSVLHVRDYGIGIKNSEDVFTKYYREDHTKKGLGLGLYIVAFIAKLHQISIEVESELGSGTTFIIAFDEVRR